MTPQPALMQQREDQALGTAWRRCEAALPEGWRLSGVMPGLRVEWLARAAPDAWHRGRRPEIDGTGPTPTAALEALADKLEAGT